jgi:hypothetical protein
MTKLLKMSWISLVNKFNSSHYIDPNNKQINNPQITSTLKSFCLSAAYSQTKKPPQLNNYLKL